MHRPPTARAADGPRSRWRGPCTAVTCLLGAVLADLVITLSVRKLLSPKKPFLPRFVAKGARSLLPGRAACGQLCEPQSPSFYDGVAGLRSVGEGRYFPQVLVPVNCTGLFDVEIAEPVWKSWGTWLSNRWMQLHDMLFDGMLWTDSYVQMLIGRHQALVGNATRCRSLSPRRCMLQAALAAASLANRRVLVFGSEHPELEAQVLAFGAAEVHSLLPIRGTRQPHPRLRLISGADWKRQFFEGLLPAYDAAVVGPRVMKRGLGEGGQGLYPYGDVIDMAKIWCMTKPGGRMVVQLARDRKREWPSLTANWAQLDRIPRDSAPTAAPEYHILTRTGRPMPRDWLLLDKYDLYYHRIGNLIWAVGSLIGICLTNEYQPRVIAEGLLPLQAVFPGLDVKLMDSKIKVEPMVHEIRGLRYEPHMVNVTPNSAISGYLQSYKYFHRHSAAIRRMFRFNAALEGSARRFIARARERLGHANDTMTVAVHVRRGDLYKFKAMTVPNDFWRRGIERLQHKFPGRAMTLIVMAGGHDNRNLDREDYAFATRHIPFPFVPTPVNHPPALDLALMVYCDAVVMSGGSFGFWGAYLNHNVCIAPDCPVSRHYTMLVLDDYYPPWCERLHCGAWHAAQAEGDVPRRFQQATVGAPLRA